MMMGPVMATAVAGVAEAATVDEEGLGEVVAFAEGAEEADGDLSKNPFGIAQRGVGWWLLDRKACMFC